MTLITEDYFANGKNLFPTEGATDKHLAQLIIDLQKSAYGDNAVILTVGAEGDYPSLQSALAVILDASAIKPYVLRCAAEDFEEDVTLKPYVFAVGAGPDASRITGRVISPDSFLAGISGFTIDNNSVAPAVDVTGGELRVFNCQLRNQGGGQSFRVTSGILRMVDSRTTQGYFEVTGGEALIADVNLALSHASIVSGGKLGLLNGRLTADAAGPLLTISAGTVTIGYLTMTNPSGSGLVMTGGSMRYQTLRVDSLAADQLALQASGGTIEAGLRNFDLGAQAQGTIEVIDNAIDASDSVSVNGVAFVESVDWAVGGDVTETAENIRDAINNSTETAVDGIVSASSAAGVITISSVLAGTAGNAHTLAESDGATDNFTLSGPTLTGGSGLSDVSGATVTDMVLGL